MIQLGRLLAGLAVAILPLSGVSAAHACGPDTDCTIGDRIYRIAMPQGHDGKTPVGAIVFAHGYKGTASGVMRNKNLRGLASKLGVALIAVKSAGQDWAIPGAPSAGIKKDTDELAYFDRVLEDAAGRFPIDRSRLMASGFSAGGMMVWNLACERSYLFAGFAPLSGTFWKPEPTSCSTPPTSIIHIHGDADPVVPLAGRKIANTHQGDVATVLKMYTAHGNFGGATPYRTQRLDCVRRSNADGKVLDFCLFEGGHSFKTAFVRHAWQNLVAD